MWSIKRPRCNSIVSMNEFLVRVVKF